jgi:hypothetical protein
VNPCFGFCLGQALKQAKTEESFEAERRSPEDSVRRLDG